MKNNINKLLKDILMVAVIATVIMLLWQGLEMIEFKEVKSSLTDTIIGVLLTYSIYANIKFIEIIKSKQ